MKYRRAERHDLVDIKGVLARSFDQTYAYYAQKSFADPVNVLVAEHEGKVAGAVNWRILDTGVDRVHPGNSSKRRASNFPAGPT